MTTASLCRERETESGTPASNVKERPRERNTWQEGTSEQREGENERDQRATCDVNRRAMQSASGLRRLLNFTPLKFM